MEKWKTLGFDPDRHDARGLRRAPEGRPRLLEEDDRLHRHQGGVRGARLTTGADVEWRRLCVAVERFMR